jgi:hypothetical protein
LTTALRGILGYKGKRKQKKYEKIEKQRIYLRGSLVFKSFKDKG